MAKQKPTSSRAKSASGRDATKIKAAAAQAFAQLRADMTKNGIAPAITTYQFIFNRMAAYSGLRAMDDMSGIDGQPFLLSPAGKSMDNIARSLARRMGAICQANQLESSNLGAVLDGVFVISTQTPLPATANQGQKIKSAKTASELPRGPKVPDNMPSPSALRSFTMRSLVPTKSTRAIEQARYDARLESLVADLRSLLINGPKKIGPIPAAKREYVEQLLALIDEHHESYKSGQVSHPFRFSHDEKAELENFCPAFKLNGLDWLEMEGKPPSGS